MKKKKRSFIKIEPGSKLPVILYATTAVLLSSIFLVISIFASGTSMSLKAPSGRKGDVNHDGKIDAADAYEIINLIKSGKTDVAADLNGDGVINEQDAALIVQYSSKTSDVLGTAAKGNTELETPIMTTVESTSSTEGGEESDEKGPTVSNGELVKSGNSKHVAFLTSDSDVYTTARVVNKWKSGGKNMYQIELTQKNNGQNLAGDSTVTVKLSGSASVEKTWDCTADSSSDGLKITSQCNSYVPTGGSIKCGLIVSSASDITVQEISK
ncbi:MAG: dockerin type I repeat-containing protein [Clostridia bacterium]|nr:dockerin type I repeat-containing protein [Clostridia bacterium]